MTRPFAGYSHRYALLGNKIWKLMRNSGNYTARTIPFGVSFEIATKILEKSRSQETQKLETKKVGHADCT